MKQAKKSQTKTYYFPKDYAPARALANQKKSQKKSKKKSSTLSKNLSKTFKKVTKTTAKASKKLITVVKANVTKKVSRKTSARKNHGKRFTWREVTLTSLIGTCALVIAFTLCYGALADPVKRSQRELEKLANAYYIEYLYPHALGKNLNQPEVILADYTKQGLPAVRLRQLLLYNDGKYASSIDAFSNNYYECDTSQTYVRYYPVEPYGPRDYTVTYGTACEKVSAIE